MEGSDSSPRVRHPFGCAYRAQRTQPLGLRRGEASRVPSRFAFRHAAVSDPAEVSGALALTSAYPSLPA